MASNETPLMASDALLRDEFAKAALTGLLPQALYYSTELVRQGKADTRLDVFLSVLAYRYADQMLEARKV